ncbi:50S ribosomal protein L9 [Candidatus Saganbacteria bacterium]|nr:50S ribosomal protein L9 [Candidatus Saganbacteria bacterium]
MKVVLFKDIENIGEADSLINVSAGYARNFLFPRKLAGTATPKAIAVMKKKQEEKRQQMEARRAEFHAMAEKLNSLEITIEADAGEGGKLFGSVTSQDISLAVSKEAGFTVEKKKISLTEPIKSLGDYKVPVKIYQEIGAVLKVKVLAK